MTTTAKPTTRSHPLDPPIAGLRILGHDREIRFRDEFGKAGRRKTRITIGRTRQRDIRLRDETSVSRLHAAITRLEDGRFMIEDAGSKNGVWIASRAGYSAYRKVEAEILEFGMIIRLGSVMLAPIDARGHCPMLAARLTEFLRNGDTVHGSRAEAARQIGLPPKSILKLFHRFLRRQ